MRTDWSLETVGQLLSGIQRGCRAAPPFLLTAEQFHHKMIHVFSAVQEGFQSEIQGKVEVMSAFEQVFEDLEGSGSSYSFEAAWSNAGRPSEVKEQPVLSSLTVFTGLCLLSKASCTEKLNWLALQLFGFSIAHRGQQHAWQQSTEHKIRRTETELMLCVLLTVLGLLSKKQDLGFILSNADVDEAKTKREEDSGRLESLSTADKFIKHGARSQDSLAETVKKHLDDYEVAMQVGRGSHCSGLEYSCEDLCEALSALLNQFLKVGSTSLGGTASCAALSLLQQRCLPVPSSNDLAGKPCPVCGEQASADDLPDELETQLSQEMNEMLAMLGAIELGNEALLPVFIDGLLYILSLLGSSVENKSIHWSTEVEDFLKQMLPVICNLCTDPEQQKQGFELFKILLELNPESFLQCRSEVEPSAVFDLLFSSHIESHEPGEEDIVQHCLKLLFLKAPYGVEFSLRCLLDICSISYSRLEQLLEPRMRNECLWSDSRLFQELDLLLYCLSLTAGNEKSWKRSLSAAGVELLEDLQKHLTLVRDAIMSWGSEVNWLPVSSALQWTSSLQSLAQSFSLVLDQVNSVLARPWSSEKPSSEILSTRYIYDEVINCLGFVDFRADSDVPSSDVGDFVLQLSTQANEEKTCSGSFRRKEWVYEVRGSEIVVTDSSGTMKRVVQEEVLKKETTNIESVDGQLATREIIEVEHFDTTGYATNADGKVNSMRGSGIEAYSRDKQEHIRLKSGQSEFVTEVMNHQTNLANEHSIRSIDSSSPGENPSSTQTADCSLFSGRDSAQRDNQPTIDIPKSPEMSPTSPYRDLVASPSLRAGF